MAIQRAFAAYNVQNSGAPLHLRIGLSVGEPVEHDNDLFGRTVQLAFRLCTHAKPDQILATEEVVAQSAGKTSLFLSRGPISPKGFDQTIQVYEVRWCSFSITSAVAAPRKGSTIIYQRLLTTENTENTEDGLRLHKRVGRLSFQRRRHLSATASAKDKPGADAKDRKASSESARQFFRASGELAPYVSVPSQPESFRRPVAARNAGRSWPEGMVSRRSPSCSRRA